MQELFEILFVEIKKYFIYWNPNSFIFNLVIEIYFVNKRKCIFELLVLYVNYMLFSI